MKKDTINIKEVRIADTLNKIITLFQSGNVPEAIAIATFPKYDVPSSGWSLANRIIMNVHDTNDARGFSQWKKVDRRVKKGEKAFYILAPRMVKVEKTDSELEEKTEKYVCTGFLPVPVFAVEQSEGYPLEYEEIELPDLPLMEKAREWGIDVKGISFHEKFLGYYQPGDNEKIRLATPSEKTFFHELAHAAYSRVIGVLKSGQDPKQEIVAELAAQTLAQLVGTQIVNTLGNSYEYINRHAKKLGKSVGRVCLATLSDVEKVLNAILSEKI